MERLRKSDAFQSLSKAKTRMNEVNQNQNAPAPANTGAPRQYSDQQYKIIAKHPETGEDVQVINTKFQHSLQAVCGALAVLGIEFTQLRA